MVGLLVRTSSTIMPSLVGWDFASRRGRECSMFFVSLFFFAFTLLKGRVCANDFAIKASEYGDAVDKLDRGKFVVVHLHLITSLCVAR